MLTCIDKSTNVCITVYIHRQENRFVSFYIFYFWLFKQNMCLLTTSTCLATMPTRQTFHLPPPTVVPLPFKVDRQGRTPSLPMSHKDAFNNMQEFLNRHSTRLKIQEKSSPHMAQIRWKSLECWLTFVLTYSSAVQSADRGTACDPPTDFMRPESAG